MARPPNEEKDSFWMKRALAIADEARFCAPPNPWVGCVIEEDNFCLAEGATCAPGKAHAERAALAKVERKNLAHATLYVTLEPCCHFGRTPPCTDAIIRSGIKTVVIGLVDPDPSVQGKGIDALQQAGITVRTGTLEDDIANQLRPYVVQRTSHIPYTVLKIAQSIDGRSAAEDGTSQWITGEEALKDAHKLRHLSQAILVGSGTILSDNPHLTVRHIPLQGPPPLRVIVDPLDQIPIDAIVFQTASSTPTLCITSGKSERNNSLANHNVETIFYEQLPIPTSWIQQKLAERGVLQLLVEGGGSTINHFFQEKTFHEIVTYVGPTLLGRTGIPSFGSLTVPTLSMAHRLTLKSIKQLGDTVKMIYGGDNCVIPRK